MTTFHQWNSYNAPLNPIKPASLSLSSPNRTKSPRSTCTRWLVLFLVCLTYIGDCFCQNLVQSLLIYYKNELQISMVQANLLFVAYTFPNFILPLIAGFIIDKVGVRQAYAGYGFILIIGQAITTYGAYQLNFDLLIIGQVMFAIGGDSLIVTSLAMIGKWFLGKEISFALGLGLWANRLFGFAENYITPILYQNTQDVLIPNSLGIILCIFSFLIVLILNGIDKKADEQELSNNDQEIEPENFEWKDLRNSGLIYFLLLIVCACLTAGFYGLVSYEWLELAMTKFGLSADNAVKTMMYIFSGIHLVPILGLIADCIGKRVAMILIGSIILFLTLIGISGLQDSTIIQKDSLILITIALALFFALYTAAYWPCIALISGKKFLGVAYGGVFVVQNIVLALIPLLIGAIHDKTTDVDQGFFWPQIVLAGITFIGTIVIFVVYLIDKKTGKTFNKGMKKRRSESYENSSYTTYF